MYTSLYQLSGLGNRLVRSSVVVVDEEVKNPIDLHEGEGGKTRNRAAGAQLRTRRCKQRLYSFTEYAGVPVQLREGRREINSNSPAAQLIY